ncbi:zinc finger protein STOP1 homolog [Magnolia sinica]|uniref:zinc finger protein STOP1 homolog n=1 Tax=Magnolia sinica TaxID=86752 RepID=UPI00265A1BFF|nr:zinc finger protein STOP1 homolog [Magnolia sinica]
MDLKQKQSSETSRKSSSTNDPVKNFMTDQQFTHFDPQQKWDASLDVGYGQPYNEFHSPSESPPTRSYNPSSEIKQSEELDPTDCLLHNTLNDWDLRTTLNNLSFLEQKIHHLKDTVHSFISQDGRFSGRLNEQAAQQQLLNADMTSIIIQLISTAGTLLPSSKKMPLAMNPPVGPFGSVFESPTSLGANVSLQPNESMAIGGSSDLGYDDRIKGMHGSRQNYVDQSEPSIFTVEGSEHLGVEENDTKDYEDAADGENLPPGSYEVLQLEKEEILAPHTHFCSICGKGFKRDANLRMHMRGHGDEYKTPAALAKPMKELNAEPTLIKRYSCPYMGCKRNKEHKKFQPLKTILCVKNHYKRTHCDKSYTCSRCNCKKFSVIADLKTHEKHCGRDKWLCSCGTTFSRKDKLFGHVALFQGHTPVLPMDEIKGSGASDHGQNDEAPARIGSKGFNFSSSSSGSIPALNIKIDDDHGYFSAMNFEACNFGGINDFTRREF